MLGNRILWWVFTLEWNINFAYSYFLTYLFDAERMKNKYFSWTILVLDSMLLSHVVKFGGVQTSIEILLPAEMCKLYCVLRPNHKEDELLCSHRKRLSCVTRRQKDFLCFLGAQLFLIHVLHYLFLLLCILMKIFYYWIIDSLNHSAFGWLMESKFYALLLIPNTQNSN